MSKRTTLRRSLVAAVIALLACGTVHDGAAQVQAPGDLRTEYASNPLGIDVLSPRLTWSYPQDGVAAYEVQVARAAPRFEDGVLWNTGRQELPATPYVTYGGPALESRTRYYWRVRGWTADGTATPWSDASWWEMGLLRTEDWSAEWIGGRQEMDHDWDSLRVTYRFTLLEAGGTDASVGFLFRARPVGKTYGDAYEWQIAHSGQGLVLRLIARTYPGGSSSATVDRLLDEIVLRGFDAAAAHELTVETEGERIRTWLDGSLIDERFDATHGSGTVGVRASAPKAVLLQGMTVERGGRIAYETRFARGANPLTAGRPTPDGLELNGGIIGRGADKDAVLPISTPAPLLRKEFDLARPVVRARLYVAAGGWPKIAINGHHVGDAALETGWTDYADRVLYETYDVTSALAEGPNTLAIELGRGWFGVTVPNEWYFHQAAWHDQPSVRAQLEITFGSGDRIVIPTDATWRTVDGPTTDDSIYLGEKYDARLNPEGWTRGGFDTSDWDSAELVRGPAGRLSANHAEPIRIVDTIDPVAMAEPAPGVVVYDFGRIIAGWVELTVEGPAGQTIALVHAEKLAADGWIEPAGGLIDGQLQTDYYTLRGGGRETWEPSFNYKGFRYVQITGFPGRPDLSSLTGKIVHSDVRSTAEFESSNDLLNAIQQAARYTLLNNTHGFVTDTPTYEKNGWTGDAQASARAAALNFDMARVWTKWLADYVDAQAETGEIPEIVPSTTYYGYEHTPGWNMVGGPVPSWDAATFVLPWEMYDLYGDRRIIEELYETQERLVDFTGQYITRDSEFRYIAPNPFLGDYAGTGPYGPLDATAVAYYYYMIDRLAASASMLGRDADRIRYELLAQDVRRAYNERYFDPQAGRYRALNDDGSEQAYAQTMNILPVAFGMVPPGRAADVVASLHEDLASKQYRLTTGVFGLRFLMTMLSDFGYTDTAYRVATRTDEPSWGWWIENGHMTMFEGWGLGSRSRDHHYHASISTWFIETLGGIRPAEPGYRRIVIRPHVPAALASVEASLAIVRGAVAVRWMQSADGRLEMDVTTPPGTPTEVHVPSADPRAITATDGATWVRHQDGRAVYIVSAGSHRFTSTHP